MKLLKANAWNWFGLGAMFLLHASTLPTLLRILQGDFTNLPPLDMILMVCAGLIGMTIRYHYAIQDKIAVVSNLIGVYNNLLIIYVITYLGTV